MNPWEWESFDSFIDYQSKVANAGPLREPISSLSIKRDDKLQLVIETVAAQDAKTSAIIPPLGTVRTNTDTVELDSYGVKVVATGVQSLGFRSKINQESRLEEFRENVLIHSLEAVIENSGDAVYTMEWLANVEDRFIWPDLTNDETDFVTLRSFGNAKDGPILKCSRKSFGGSRNCVKLSVANVDLYLGVSLTTLTEKRIKPGFILYIGTLSDDVRLKIRDCLSFSLGMYLVYLGYSTFNQDWDLTSFKAVSAYSIDEKVFDERTLPPSPLGSRWENEIDSLLLTRAINALYSKYDTLEFGRLSWMYWHAVYAPVHTAAVQFGATIEALQNIYFQGLAKTKLLVKTDWDVLNPTVQVLQGLISGLDIEDRIKSILKSKLGQLNDPPQNVMAERLLKILQLDLGELEKAAWKRRHDAAHGNEVENNDYIRLIRDVKLLKIRFHRILLCITGAFDSYYDYYTLGHPKRNLRDPVPDDFSTI